MFRGKDEKLRVRHVELGGACGGHPCGNGHMTTGCLDHFLFTDIEAVLSGSTALLYLLCGHTTKIPYMLERAIQHEEGSVCVSSKSDFDLRAGKD